MRRDSHFTELPRRTPQQARGERRVSELLDATAHVIATVGYDAATMCAIAERAGAPIGSLYQFFPNKPAIVQALRTQYVQKFEEMWSPLEAEAATLDLDGVVRKLIDSTIRFADENPAFLALLDAPSSTRSPAAIRQVIKEGLAACLLACRPGLPQKKALELATVTLQMLRAMNQLYAEVPAQQKRGIVHEFKIAVLSYLNVRTEIKR
jgi:AcrR family transcriptional regulator